VEVTYSLIPGLFTARYNNT